MADSTTPPGTATRWIETSRGILTYAQLAPLLAANPNLPSGMNDENALAGIARKTAAAATTRGVVLPPFK